MPSNLTLKHRKFGRKYLGKNMESNLTLKQEKFAQEYLETGNVTEAADRAYKPKNRNTAHAIGAENLRKPAIRAFLNEKTRDAVAMVYKLSQKAESEAVRLNASKDILDRAGYFVNREEGAEPIERERPIPLLGLPLNDVDRKNCGLSL
jgi:phage terminase small subunit